MNQEKLKETVAQAALAYLVEGQIVGVGTGSTARKFIDALAKIKDRIPGAVASSEETSQRLKAHGIRVFDLNTVDNLPVYIDGADEIDSGMNMIKGGGGALTREKIVAAVAKTFICIADQSKSVDTLGRFPLAVEVIPMARAHVARQIVALGGTPVLRADFVTDNGNIILDVNGLSIRRPAELETRLNQIVGVVCNGLFALRPADVCLLGTVNGVKTLVRQPEHAP